MIKKTFGIIATACSLALSAAAASAATFTVDVANSSVALTDTGSGLLCGITNCGVTASLAAGLGGMTFDLTNPGEFETFDFLTFTGSGGGIANYDITATLTFNAPAVSATGGGTGSVLLAFGSIVAGSLSWDTGVPTQVGFGGGGLATISFGEGIGLFLGNTVTTSASVTLDVTPVPLPAAGWTLLAGLGAIAAMKRRKKSDV